MSDARRTRAVFPSLGSARTPDRVIVPVDDPPQREGLLGVALYVREMVGEIAKSCGETKKKLLELRDRVAQCLQDLGWDDADAGASPDELEVLVDDVASMVGELMSSHSRLEELAEDVRMGLDMTRVEFESWRAGGCRPQYRDDVVAAGTGGGRLRAALDESAEILRGVLGDHE